MHASTVLGDVQSLITGPIAALRVLASTKVVTSSKSGPKQGQRNGYRLSHNRRQRHVSKDQVDDEQVDIALSGAVERRLNVVGLIAQQGRQVQLQEGSETLDAVNELLKIGRRIGEQAVEQVLK